MEIIIPLFVFGAMVDGITGIVLNKWPAKSLLGNTFKGAALAVGILFIFVLFLSLIALIMISSNMDGSGPSS